MNFSEKYKELKKYSLKLVEQMVVCYPENENVLFVNVFTESGVKIGSFNTCGGNTLLRYDIFESWGGILPTEIKMILQA